MSSHNDYNRFVRPRYFSGMMLTAQDLQAEQLQKVLRIYTQMLAEMASVENLTELEDLQDYTIW